MRKLSFFIVYTVAIFLLGRNSSELFNRFFHSGKGDISAKNTVVIKKKSHPASLATPHHKKGTHGVKTYNNDDIRRDALRLQQRKAAKNEYTEKEIRELRQKGGGNLVVRDEKNDNSSEVQEESKDGVDKFFDTLRKEAGDLVEKAKQLVEKPEFKNNPAIQEMMSKNPEQIKESIHNGVKKRNEAMKNLNKNID
jgi:hypothetical protein